MLWGRKRIQLNFWFGGENVLSSPPSEGKLIWDVILQQPGATTTSSTPCPEEHPAPWNVVPLIPPQGQCDPTWLHGTGVLSPPPTSCKCSSGNAHSCDISKCGHASCFTGV